MSQWTKAELKKIWKELPIEAQKLYGSFEEFQKDAEIVNQPEKKGDIKKNGKELTRKYTSIRGNR